MKVLVVGHIPVPAKDWWIGQRLTCGHCRTQFELEEKDAKKVNVMTEKISGGKSVLTVACPTCKTEVTKQKPVLRGLR